MLILQLEEASQSGGPVFDWTNEADRIFYSQLAIKFADIGGPAKRFDIHYMWTQHICEEFYQQVGGSFNHSSMLNFTSLENVSLSKTRVDKPCASMHGPCEFHA